MKLLVFIPVIWIFVAGWISKQITKPPPMGSGLFYLLWIAIVIGVPYVLFELIIGIPVRELIDKIPY